MTPRTIPGITRTDLAGLFTTGGQAMCDTTLGCIADLRDGVTFGVNGEAFDDRRTADVFEGYMLACDAFESIVRALRDAL